MDRSMIKFHNQTTGQMLHTHIDNFAARPERENSFKVTEMDLHPETMRRFAIMLADWELGQIFQIGNANFTQWRAGDCITWEWFDMPHSTANAGYDPRVTLQLTGVKTDRTYDFLAHPSCLVIADPELRLADQFGALKTPHAFVLSTKGELLYRGGVDSSSIAERADRHYLRDALTAIAAGKEPEIKEARALGCVIQRN